MKQCDKNIYIWKETGSKIFKIKGVRCFELFFWTLRILHWPMRLDHEKLLWMFDFLLKLYKFRNSKYFVRALGIFRYGYFLIHFIIQNHFLKFISNPFCMICWCFCVSKQYYRPFDNAALLKTGRFLFWEAKEEHAADSHHTKWNKNKKPGCQWAKLCTRFVPFFIFVLLQENNPCNASMSRIKYPLPDEGGNTCNTHPLITPKIIHTTSLW